MERGKKKRGEEKYYVINKIQRIIWEFAGMIELD